MTFNWSDYLSLARELLGKATTPFSQEAKQRSAISRAYYAAFIEARNFLRDQDGVIIPQESPHQYVIKQFKNSPDSARGRVGRKLQFLRYYRNQADYDDTVVELTKKSKDALTLARQIISGLSRL